MGTADGTVIGATQIVNSGPASRRWNIAILGDGYREEELPQFATDVQDIADTLLTTSPFDELRSAINIWRVDVTSTDSGADDPVTCTEGVGTVANTYFDASFCHAGIQRALQVDDALAISVANAQVPEWHVVMVVVNSLIPGGTGGGVAVMSRLGVQTAIHELGHTAFRLRDEYDYWESCADDTDRNVHPAADPHGPNVTTNTNPSTLKWRALVLPTTALPTLKNEDPTNCNTAPSAVPAGTVGLFEGGNHYHSGVFRPEHHCKMRSLSRPFCAVCRNEIRSTLAEFTLLPFPHFGYDDGWRIEKHPRFLADVTGNGRADIVGFGSAGVWVSLSRGDGTFDEPQLVIRNFAQNAGGWRVAKHPRFLADVTGNGRADIVGFGSAGVWVSLSRGDGTFDPARMGVANFAYDAGGWRVDKHPRFLADVTGDGRADIVGFGSAGVWVSLSRGDGTFDPARMGVANFAYDAGGWRVDKHPRFLADVTGNGRADIVGFGSAGVWVSLSRGDGTFDPPRMGVADFAYDAGGWRVDKHPRLMADVSGDGCADIIGFGSSGVLVSFARGDGTFGPPQLVVANFGQNAGGWRVGRHPRFAADVTGDGRADIVGFGSAGVWVSRSRGDGTFGPTELAVPEFGYDAGGWRVARHPRLLGDVTGDARADVVGFGIDGAWVFPSLMTT